MYFSRPDSYVFGKSVNEVRTNLGRVLAREQRVDADVVVPIPDSGVCAAMGYADEANIPLRMGLIRNHYVGRDVPILDYLARLEAIGEDLDDYESIWYYF